MVRKKQRPKYSNWEFVKDLWHFFGFYKWGFLFFSFLLVLTSLMGLATPIILAKIVDFFVEGSKNMNLFYTYIGILLGLEIIGTVMRLRSKYALSTITNNIQKYARVKSFNRLMQGDLVWHEKEFVGSKIQKISQGENAFRKFIHFYNNHGVNMVVSLVGILVVFAYFSPKYALISFVFMFVYLFAEVKFNNVLAKKTLRLNIINEKAVGREYEFSSNISTVKSLGMGRESNKQIEKNAKRVLEAKVDKRKLTNLKWITIQIIASVFFVLFIFIVGKDILVGALTAGSIVIYISYLGKLRNNFNIISGQSETLIDFKYALYRMMQIYNLVPEIDEGGAKNLEKWNKIKIKNLTFDYKNEGVLEGFNLEIKKGDRIGIVGKSGGGKSTLFKLLLKLYLPKRGMISFDGKPITEIKQESLANKISIVLQDTELFNLSLKENVTISRGGVFNFKDYNEAIKISQVDKIIKKLKQGEKSLLGEKGVRLSGGEKQRLGIARAIYKNSDIIIFDEATSNLDYGLENKIQDGLSKLKGKTLIFAAHRLSTLKNTDNILFLNKGRIVEQGTFNQLVERKGQFYKMWKKQGGK